MQIMNYFTFIIVNVSRHNYNKGYYGKNNV